jgi:hypothetical protein
MTCLPGRKFLAGLNGLFGVLFYAICLNTPNVGSLVRIHGCDLMDVEFDAQSWGVLYPILLIKSWACVKKALTSHKS